MSADPEGLTFRFRARYPWALLPSAPTVDTSESQRTAKLYATEFRWQRAARKAELCWPWRRAQELGWCVASPVDVTLTPLEEQEVTRDPDELQSLAQLAAHAELWRRADSAFLLRPAMWLRFHQYRTTEGWCSMFVPNGDGSVEWKLGWDVEIPSDFFLLVLPWIPLVELEIPMGLLGAKTLQRLNGSDGISIAIRPRSNLRIARGDPIARIVPLHRSSLQAHAVLEEST